MKFKENAIEPDIIVHCRTEEEAKALVEELYRVGYRWKHKPTYDGDVMWCDESDAGGEYYKAVIEYDTKGEEHDYIYHVPNNGLLTYLEFSEMFDPEPVDNSTNNLSNVGTEMSAVEVLEWLRDNDGKQAMKDVFGCTYYNKVMYRDDMQEVVDEITTYEAAKKVPKSIEIEWVDYVEITDGYNAKSVYTRPVDTNFVQWVEEKISGMAINT